MRSILLPRTVVIVALVTLLAVNGWLVWRVGLTSPQERTLSSQTALPRPPAGLSTGSYVKSRILPTGRLQVTQWVRSRAPLSTLRLSLPAGARREDGVALDVRVDSQAGTVFGPLTVRRSSNYDIPVPATLLRIRYELDGVVVRSPSVPGRVLVRATFLDASYDKRSGTTRVTLAGGRVRSAACTSEVASAVARPCGQQVGTGWVVDLRGPHRGEGVIAQVDLS